MVYIHCCAMHKRHATTGRQTAMHKYIAMHNAAPSVMHRIYQTNIIAMHE